MMLISELAKKYYQKLFFWKKMTFLVFFYRPRFYPFLARLSPGATPQPRQPRQKFFLVIWHPPLAERQNRNRDPSIWDAPVEHCTQLRCAALRCTQLRCTLLHLAHLSHLAAGPGS